MPQQNWREELHEQFSMDAPTKALEAFIETLLARVIDRIPLVLQANAWGNYRDATEEVKQQLRADFGLKEKE